MSLIFIPVGVIVGLIIPLISIAFACTTFYASFDAVDKLRKRRQRKLRTVHDSLIQIGYSTNVVKSLVVFDQAHLASSPDATKVSSMEANNDILSPDYVLELTRNQERVNVLKDKLALLKQRLELLKSPEGSVNRNVSTSQSHSVPTSSKSTTKATAKDSKGKESDRKSSDSKRSHNISSNTSSDRKVSKEGLDTSDLSSKQKMTQVPKKK